MPYKNPKTGKNVIVFSPTLGGISIKVPCGQCIGCRLERSRTWAIRCMNEAQLHEHNYFVTLTYNDENLPLHNTLYPRHLQLFFKRLRKSQPVRYFSCGEYGDENNRPHYHAIIYNLRLNDRKYYKTKNGFRLDTSDMLTKMWGLGHVNFGSVTFESCAYVARYIVKKQNGQKGLTHYNVRDENNNYLCEREPEFTRMSLKPGIGSGFYETYKSDMYPEGRTILRGGISSKTPRYYDDKYAITNPTEMELIKEQRRIKALEYEKETTRSRLNAREIVHLAKNNQLKRTLE